MAQDKMTTGEVRALLRLLAG